MKSFQELGLSVEMLKALEVKGFEEPTQIQQDTIPAILHGVKDVVAQSQTGTGKTAAFALPIIDSLEDHQGHVQVIVLAPTRELAIQVAEEMSSLKGTRKLRVLPVYGGQSIGLQLGALKRGVDIVVGTPGRVLDHLKRGTLDISQISFAVLDEADEMLNMGFQEEVEGILEKTPKTKRTMLFSATMPDPIMKIAKKYMNEYDVIKIAKGALTVSKTDQIYFQVSAGDKFEALCRIIDMEEDFYGVVFCRTKRDVDEVSNHLGERGYGADTLHGDISQALREKILTKFKNRRINVLVATDVAARGIDVQDITHVINYALPQDPEAYVHRIGRTGRAGKKGIAITFVTPAEYRRLQFIERVAKTSIRQEKLPQASDIVANKKKRIVERLNDMIEKVEQDEYFTLAQELLQDRDPEHMMAALLQFAFEGELDVKNYREIDDKLIDVKGTTRLFIPQGTNENWTKSKIIEIISEQCGIKSSLIRDVKVMEKFSFVTLPFKEAELVLETFKSRKSDKGLYVIKAKDDKGDRGDRGGRGSRGGDRADSRGFRPRSGASKSRPGDFKSRKPRKKGK